MCIWLPDPAIENGMLCQLSQPSCLVGRSYRYGEKIYFSSNTGAGIFEVESTSLKAVLDRTGADACDFTGSR